MLQELLDRTQFLRSLLLIFGLLLTSSYFAKKMILELLPYSLFRFLIVPGVIIHELSHAAGCFLTGANVESISVFDKEGGSVTHGEPYLKFLGPTIIAMAPIAGGLGMFYLWSYIVNTPFQSFGQGDDLISAADMFLSRLGSVNWISWEIWLYFYGCLNLVICVSPSLEDFKNCKWELVIIIFLIGILEYFKILNGGIISNYAYRFTTPLILIALFFLILVLPIYLICKKSKS